MTGLSNFFKKSLVTSDLFFFSFSGYGSLTRSWQWDILMVLLLVISLSGSREKLCVVLEFEH